jgi:hypothetical protein
MAMKLHTGARHRGLPRKDQPRVRFIAQIYRLALVAQTLLVAVEFHPLFALMLGDFRFASFLQ